jgi:hypothetical protein
LTASQEKGIGIFFKKNPEPGDKKNFLQIVQREGGFSGNDQKLPYFEGKDHFRHIYTLRL